MLPKLVGCVIIFASCCGMGYSKSHEMQLHLDELEELKKMFYLLKSELEYTRAPFAEIFDKIAEKMMEPYQAWLKKLSNRIKRKDKRGFWDIWNTSIEEDLRDSRLKEDELKELRQVGKNLEYIENVNLYIEQMEYRIKNIREIYRSKRKLCQSLGIMGGIFLVILLL